MQDYQFSSNLYTDEASCLADVLQTLNWNPQIAQSSQEQAKLWIEKSRASSQGDGHLTSFLLSFPLDTREGIAIMCLSEALLRIPDAPTINALIRDKTLAANWLNENKQNNDWLVNAASFCMLLTRKTLEGVLADFGEPVIRTAIRRAMILMGRQFVIGETINKALSSAKYFHKQGYQVSYDMLGESARNAEMAAYYFQSYLDAIDAVGKYSPTQGLNHPGISIKLSSLHPRYNYLQKDRCVPELTEKLLFLARRAASYDIALTVDAEESNRLNICMDIVKNIISDPSLSGWRRFGVAVQAYQKAAIPVIDHLANLARTHRQRIQIRLVKGAYWDTEIKLAQMAGLSGYPVYTRKCNTDVSYLACVSHMLKNCQDAIYPMFATHNAHTIATIRQLTIGKSADFELQRLYGMGETLYQSVKDDSNDELPMTVYAPVGPYEDLLPYLVRRLLENGANSSFIHKLFDKRHSIEEIASDPVKTASSFEKKSHPSIPLPDDIFGAERKNSAGIELSDPHSSQSFIDYVQSYQIPQNQPAISLINGEVITKDITDSDINRCFTITTQNFTDWNNSDISQRSAIINRFADLLHEHRNELMAILVHEAGKTMLDAIAEWREAIDFCRYYAKRGLEEFTADGRLMPGYTGEQNRLTLQGRGTFFCISPWNFPLAIFLGQITAALIAGNCVIAKPAPQTPLIARRAIELLHQAGVPLKVLHLILGDSTIGSKIVAHPALHGIAFTGSTATAKAIQRTLAHNDGPIIPFIAETGGQNAMIVDSSALLEQATDDIIFSAFGSTGQRCSALRILYVQDDIADRLIQLLQGAIKELAITNPYQLNCDIGPVIDKMAHQRLETHIQYLEAGAGICLGRAALKDNNISTDWHFFAPTMYEIKNINVLRGEVFGPVLHIIRFKSSDLNKVVQDINNSGFGLTFGIHSRIDIVNEQLSSQIRAGNIYVNRNTIGAIVGVQPFGGMGLSGTGPKAGGPHYLHAFAVEKHISTDTTAMGGNTSLVCLED